MTTDRDREAFEAWCAATFGPNWATHIWSPERDMCRKTWQAALTHARVQAGEPAAAASWTREDLAAGLAELDGIELAPPLQSVVDLEYLNRADDLLTFLSVASVANQPLGTAHPAPAQEPVAVPAGWKLVPTEPTPEMIDAWHRASWPTGPSVSPLSQQGLAFVRYYDAMLAAAPVSPPAESGEKVHEEAALRSGAIDRMKAAEARAETAERERDEARAEVERLREVVTFAHDGLWEIDPSHYTHDEVCKLNNASVEVILALAPLLGRTHGKSAEWWAERKSPLAIAPAPAPEV